MHQYISVREVAFSFCMKMFGLLLCVLCVLLCAAQAFEIGQNALRPVVVPHNCKPGYIVTSVSVVGQNFMLDASRSKLLIDSELQQYNISQHFTVLNNGDIIVLSDISCFLSHLLKLVIINNLGLETWVDELVVEVKDGDHLLQFSQQSYEGHILENLPAFSFVRNLEGVRASIVANENAFVWYAIVSGPFDLFEIYQNEHHNLLIRTLASFDFEKDSQYLITVIARTGNLTDEPAIAKIWILINNANDNFPVMETPYYEANILRGSLAGFEFLSVRATDDDKGKLEYFIIDSDEFGIHASNGSLYLQKPCLELRVLTYDLKVFARDEGGKESKPVLVHINVEEPVAGEVTRWKVGRSRRDLRPVKVVEVPETMVQDLLDLDNNFYEVFAFKEPAPKRFEINHVTGTVRLRTGEKFDFETEREVDFAIQVTRVDDPACKYPLVFPFKLINLFNTDRFVKYCGDSYYSFQ